MSGIHHCLIMSPHLTLEDKRALSCEECCVLTETGFGLDKESLKLIFCCGVLMISCFTSAVVSCSSGVHHGHVLPPDVGWRAAEIRGPNWNPAAQQPHGGKDLDTGHIFPKLKEVYFSQHDDAKQTVPHHEEWDCPLHHEVIWHCRDCLWENLFFTGNEASDVFLRVLLLAGWQSAQTARWGW